MNAVQVRLLLELSFAFYQASVPPKEFEAVLAKYKIVPEVGKLTNVQLNEANRILRDHLRSSVE